MSAQDDHDFLNSPEGSTVMLWVIPIFTVPFFVIGMVMSLLSGSLMVSVLTLGLTLYGAAEWDKHHERLRQWQWTSVRTHPIP